MARTRKTEKHGADAGENGRAADWPFAERCLATAALRTLYLWGPPGVGKSWIAYRKGRVSAGVYAITLTDETPAAELRGFWMPERDGFVWRDGPVVMAMREGARLVINELSHASPDVLALLYPVLESRETARLTLPTGETVVPAAGFHVVATSNDPPDTLPGPLRDRFDATIRLGSPHPEALARLSERLRHAALQTFDLEPERALSLRSWLKLQELEPEFGLEDGCRAVFGEERGRHVFEALSMQQLSFQEGGAQ